MFKKLLAAGMMLVTASAMAQDTTLNGKVWSVYYNTGSAFYSGQQGEQEVTMECMLGEMTFGMNDDETGAELNSHDDQVYVVIDSIIYKAPTTLAGRRSLYDAISHASSTFELRTGTGEQSKVYPVKELRDYVNQVEFDLSDCKE